MARLSKCPIFLRLRGGRQDEKRSGIWEGAVDGPRWIRGCICSTACSSPARRRGGDMQSVAYSLDNTVMPSHEHIFIFMLSVSYYRSITKGGVYRRKGGGGENSDKAGTG